ncbi:MAG: phosphoglucosamine mutase [Acidobacteria bacterium]|nr:phosphoglucosamine mutase [Acidobacteriota bacterium]
MKLFGTDGIRGRAGEFPLDDATIAAIGRAVGEHLRDRLGRSARIITGRDTRESGEHIERVFLAAASGTGARCLSAGVITTPGVAFLTAEGGFDVGVVISASHNPYEDNGIKLFTPSGKKLSELDERELEARISELTRIAASAADAPAELEHYPDADKKYLVHLTSNLAELRLDGLRVALDCANGAASHLAPELFRGLGAEVRMLACDPDGRNINRDCGSLHLEGLQAAVAESGADIGIAFDGDADRCLFVDAAGKVVDGDATLWILANEMQRSGELKSGKVIATVMSNMGLEIALREAGIELVRANVGDKYVLEEILRTEAEFGGEQSGHIIVRKVGLVGDGMMTALLVLNAMTTSGKPLGELAAGFARLPQVLVNQRVREKVPFETVPAIQAAADDAERKLAGQGRLLLRYSGTENLARVMIEGRDQSEIEEMANGIAAVIREAIG